MAIALFKLLIFLIPAIFIAKQVVLPLLRNNPLFPMFKNKPQLVKNAEKNLIEAQTAKEAAKIEQEAARLNKEALSLNEKLYNTETDKDET